MASHAPPPPQPTTSRPTTSSRMPQLYNTHRKILQRLDDLESRLASRVAAHRRRATNLIDETPTHRRTHMRIFVSHRVEEEHLGEEDDDKKEEDGNDGGGGLEKASSAVGGGDVSAPELITTTANATSASSPSTTRVPSGFAGSISNLMATTAATNNTSTDAAATANSDTTTNTANNPQTPSAATSTVQPGIKAQGGGGKDFKALLSAAAHHHHAESYGKDGGCLETAKKNNPKRKWTLVIEGGLLVGNLDHESAKEVDRRLDEGSSILGCMDEEKRDDASSKDQAKANEKEEKKTDPIAASSDDSKVTSDGIILHELSPMGGTTQSTKAVIPLRDQWRGGVTEREGELVIDPLIFTHLFDKMEVELKIAKQKPTAGNAVADGNVEKKEVELTRSVKTITWERTKANIPDSQAFFIAHDEEGISKPANDDANIKSRNEFSIQYIDAKIKLYRRQGEEGNYIPSKELCDVFFPTFVGKMAKEMKNKEASKASKKNKKRKRSLNEAQSSSMDSTLLSRDATPNADQSPTTSNAAQNDAHASATTEEKDIYIPNNVTMDEALGAVFFYIRTRGLQDATDLSIINNDETLSQLFGCNRMLLSAVRGLLLQNELLTKVESCSHPIIFNYRMTLEGAEPLTKKRGSNSKKDAVADVSHDENPGEKSLTTRKRSANDAEGAQTAKMDQDEQTGDDVEDIPVQTMLSCDVDIEVPSLFHTRTRDILRRTKYREFEYSSSRTKAAKYLMATKVDEETAKLVLEDVVTGKGYAPYHKQAWMALARGSHEGGEAQRAAYIDLRTTALIEKLDERTSVSRGYWDVVDACRGL